MIPKPIYEVCSENLVSLSDPLNLFPLLPHPWIITYFYFMISFSIVIFNVVLDPILGKQ